MAGQGLNPQSLGGSENVGAEESASVQTDKATIKNTDESLIYPLSREYAAAAHDSNADHFAVYFDSGTTEMVVVMTTDPFTDDTGWTELKRWTVSSENTEVDYHITSQDTHLIIIAGGIKRSTDGGNTWSEVQDVGGTGIGGESITEDSSGNLYAQDSGTTQFEIYESTDDGATWSEIADETTLSNFPDEVHCYRVVPGNDAHIATGGDAASTRGFYVSTDGGSSYFHVTTERQWFPILTDPQDSDHVFLISDDSQGGRVLEVSGLDTATSASGITTTMVANLDVPQATLGAFEGITIKYANHPNQMLMPTLDTHLLYVSHEDEKTAAMVGKDWRVISGVGFDIGNATHAPGNGEKVISDQDVNGVIIGDRVVRLARLPDSQFYGGAAQPVRDVDLTGKSLRSSTIYMDDPDGTSIIQAATTPLFVRDETGSNLTEFRSGYQKFAATTQFGGVVNFLGNTLKSPPNNTTADSMTANPESDTEDGYIEFDIGGTLYQVPIYAP